MQRADEHLCTTLCICTKCPVKVLREDFLYTEDLYTSVIYAHCDASKRIYLYSM
ncbi:hypothetical protein DOLIC_00056 [Dolichomitus sp. PSUC_FEM 10030005]|nr:hypothetical protein [Dolichomitus sp. PSUC_FEM 10030005]